MLVLPVVLLSLFGLNSGKYRNVHFYDFIIYIQHYPVVQHYLYLGFRTVPCDTVTTFTYVCVDGHCISSKDVCDGIADCP